MSEIFFSGGVVVFALLAVFSRNMQRSILALWMMGISLSGFFLLEGVGFLAVLQGFVSTGMALSLVFFSLLFGEWKVLKEPESLKQRMRLVFSVGLGACFGGLVWEGAQLFLSSGLMQKNSATHAQGLGALGKVLNTEQALSFLIFVLIMLFVMVGSGVVARLELKAKCLLD
jgi:NADH:ubiquinone oxidoreductase subunit 6 (subunit J)